MWLVLRSAMAKCCMAKKCHATMMETNMKIAERVGQGEKVVDVTHSYNMNCSASSTILKNKDKMMEHVMMFCCCQCCQ